MSVDSVHKKIKHLQDRLRLYDYQYYVLDEPLVPDIEYDRCFKELQALENDNPHYITPDSPTQRVGVHPVGTFEEIVHIKPMLSLTNVFSEKELEAFFKRVTD